jgi:hypothetical protein
LARFISQKLLKKQKREKILDSLGVQLVFGAVQDASVIVTVKDERTGRQNLRSAVEVTLVGWHHTSLLPINGPSDGLTRGPKKMRLVGLPTGWNRPFVFLSCDTRRGGDRQRRNYADGGRRAAKQKRSLATARSHCRRGAPPDSQAHSSARRRVLSSASVQACSLFLLATFYRFRSSRLTTPWFMLSGRAVGHG